MKKYIAKVEPVSGVIRIMTGYVHRLRGKLYLVEEGDIAEWHPVVSDIYPHIWYDVYGREVFLRDIVGFVTPDGQRKIGIVFEDEEWGASIREVTMIFETFDPATGYGAHMESSCGEDYYLVKNGFLRLGSSLHPDFVSIETFISGRSKETDRLVPAQKIEYEELQG